MTEVAYIDPATGERYPLDPPIWRSPGGGPLMLTALPGIRRGDIDTATRSLWRYRRALPFEVERPVSLGEPDNSVTWRN